MQMFSHRIQMMVQTSTVPFALQLHSYGRNITIYHPPHNNHGHLHNDCGEGDCGRVIVGMVIVGRVIVGMVIMGRVIVA